MNVYLYLYVIETDIDEYCIRTNTYYLGPLCECGREREREERREKRGERREERETHTHTHTETEREETDRDEERDRQRKRESVFCLFDFYILKC